MEEKGIYLFSVARGDGEQALDVRGIAGRPVHTLGHGGYIVVCQECEPKPFSSEDPNKLAEYVLTHEDVVEMSWEKFDNIVPFAFGTVIVAKAGASARENLNGWLEEQSRALGEKLDRLKNKAEYGVQILWNSEQMVAEIRSTDPEAHALEKEMRSQSKGTAYLVRKKLEDHLKQKFENLANEYFTLFYRRIKAQCEDIRVGKIRKETPPMQMLLNVSCLVEKGETRALGDELGSIGKMRGVDVRFMGPWPAYSFAGGGV